MKDECIGKSNINGTRQPILNKFALDNPAGYKTIETADHRFYKKVNISFLNKTTTPFEETKKSVCEIDCGTKTNT